MFLPSTHAQPDPHDHVPEDFGQLGVRQRQGPQTEVGCSVRHRPERVLDGVNALQRKEIIVYWRGTMVHSLSEKTCNREVVASNPSDGYNMEWYIEETKINQNSQLEQTNFLKYCFNTYLALYLVLQF